MHPFVQVLLRNVPYTFERCTSITGEQHVTSGVSLEKCKIYLTQGNLDFCTAGVVGWRGTFFLPQFGGDICAMVIGPYLPSNEGKHWPKHPHASMIWATDTPL